MNTPLIAITPGDDGPARDLGAWFGPLAEAGLRVVLIREPHVTEERLGELCEAATAAGLDAWVHDRHPAARRRAEGLHLTASGTAPAGRRFGQSCHDPGELDRAFAGGATYALLSPVFRPTSKPLDPREPLGVDRFMVWAAGRPVFALGGVTPERAAAIAQRGGRGVAVLGGIFCEPDARAGAKRVSELLAPWSDAA